jgi:prophage antirepressor-like protein
MSTALRVFNFLNGEKGHEIRVTMVNGEPWWVAKDVLAVLEVGNVTDATKRLDDDEFDSIEVTDTQGRDQFMIGINEAGLYSLVLGSRKPQAKAFKRWITHDVIPSIRKTGTYNAKPMSASEQIVLLMKAHTEQYEQVEAVRQEVQEVRGDIEMLKQTTTLTTSQQRKVQTGVGGRVHHFTNSDQIKRKLYAELYREIKDRWGVGSYRDLPCVELDNVLAYIGAWRPKAD